MVHTVPVHIPLCIHTDTRSILTFSSIDTSREEANGGPGEYLGVQSTSPPPTMLSDISLCWQNMMIKKHVLELTTSFIIPLVCAYSTCVWPH